MISRSLFGLTLLTTAVSGETLHLLVLEVDHRLVNPTYERSISTNPASLEDAITKLRKLSPGKGVKEWLNLEIQRDDPLKRIETDAMKHVNSPQGGSRRYEVGHEHRWSRTEQFVSRSLKLSAIVNRDNLPRYSFSFTHHLNAHWTMSAGVATPQGALFVFEKLSIADPKAAAPQWVLSTLLDKKSNRPAPEMAPERLSKPPIGRTAIVRLPQSSLGSSAEFDQAIHTEYSQGFSKSSVIFQVWNKTSKPGLKLEFPERSTIKMDMIAEHRGNSQITHQGEFTLLLDQNPNIGTFETTQRDKKREGSKTSGKVSTKKPRYYLESYLISPTPPS